MRFNKGLVFVSTVMFLALFSIFVGKVNAAVFQFGVVTGAVSNSGNPVAGANVSVTCNSNVLNAITNVNGVYFVQYSNVQCPVGQLVSVNASSGSMAGSNSGTMMAGSAVGGVQVDVAVVNVPLVPEFGLMIGAVTSLVSGGLFFLKRRS